MQVEKIPAIVGGLGYSPADENKHQRYNGGGIHMGIFSRIGDIMKANVNDLIDKAEDPEKMVKQIIRDLQQEVAKSTQALGKAMASQRIAERQYKTALQSSADWESKAKAALAAGNTISGTPAFTPCLLSATAVAASRLPPFGTWCIYSNSGIRPVLYPAQLNNASWCPLSSSSLKFLIFSPRFLLVFYVLANSKK